MNIEQIYNALAEIIERRENVKIEFKIERNENVDNETKAKAV